MKIIKIRLLIIILLAFFPVFSYCNETKTIIKDMNALNSWQMEMNLKNNKTAILNEVEKYKSSIYYSANVYIYFNGIWTLLPDTLKENGVLCPIVISSESKLRFDSIGNIWLSGPFLFKYDGEKWTHFFVNDKFYYNGYRTYGDFCIDKNNNIWVTTQVYNYNWTDSSNYYNFSEIYKFDGQNFTKLLETKSTLSFMRFYYSIPGFATIALSDGRVLIYRMYNFENIGDDLYFFNEDGTYSTMRLIVPLVDSTSNFFTKNKIVTQILEDKDRLFFCLDVHKWFDTVCCGGASLYENTNWITFDTTNDLQYYDLYKNSSLQPIYFFLKLSDSNYLALGKQKIYNLIKVDNIWKFKLLSWEKLLNSSTYLITSKDSTSYMSFLKGLYDIDYCGYFGCTSMIKQSNGDIWINLQNGILIFNESLINSLTDVESNEPTNNEIAISPNPANDYININNAQNYSNYQIYNILGNIVLEGDNNNNTINIFNILSGLYFIKLYNQNSYKVLNFIKN